MSFIRPVGRARQLLRNNVLTRLKVGLPRHKTGRNPLLARAGGSGAGGPLPGGRATRGVGALVILILVLTFGRTYLGQRFGVTAQVERIIRAEAIPMLEKELGMPVTVGTIQSDWLSRIILTDVVVGVNPKLPTGAFVTVDSLTLDVDLLGAASGSNPFPDALKRVQIDGPSVYLHRNTRGRWNFQKLLERPGAGASTTWDGEVTWKNGRIYLLDDTTRTASGVALSADVQQVSGEATSLRNGTIQMSTLGGYTLLGAQKRRLGSLTARGNYNLTSGTGAGQTTLPTLPLPLLFDYFVPPKDAVATAGTASGVVDFVWNGKELAPRGTLQVTDLNLSTGAIKSNQISAPLRVQGLSGPLQFSTGAISTSQIAFSSLGANWEAAGTVALLPTPVFDLRFASKNANLDQAKTLAPPGLLPPGLRMGPVAISARAAGEMDNLSVTGAAQTTSLQMADARLGSGKAATLRAVFSARVTPGTTPTFATRFSATGVEGQSTEGRAVLSSVVGAVRSAGDPLQVELSARDWRAYSPHYGSSQGTKLDITAASPDAFRAAWRGDVAVERAQTQNINLRAVSAEAAQAIQKSGTVTARAQFQNLSLQDSGKLTEAIVRGRFDLEGATLVAPQVGTIQVSAVGGNLFYSQGDVRVSDLRARTDAGNIVVDLLLPQGGAPRFTARSSDARLIAQRLNPLLAEQGILLDGQAVGTVAVTSASDTRSGISATFDLNLPLTTARAPGSSIPQLRLEQARVYGSGNYLPSNNDWRGQVTLESRGLQVGSGQVGRTSIVIPPQLARTRMTGTRITLRGSGKGVATPNITGAFRADTVTLPPLTLGTTQIPALVVNAPSGIIEAENNILSLSRFRANWGGNSKITGTARVTPDGVTAQLLASDLDAANLQRRFASATLKDLQVTGTVATRVEVRTRAGILVPTVDAVLHDGSLSARGARFPLNVATAVIELGPNGTLEIPELVVWSQGGRLSANGTVGPMPGGETGFDGALNVRDFQLASLSTLPGLLPLKTSAGADGLVSGDFEVKLDSTPTLEGEVRMRLATAYGLDIERVDADVEAALETTGFNVNVTRISGSAEGAPFSGEVTANEAQNSWTARLVSTRLGATGIARASNISPSALPLRGDIAADINISGTLSKNGNIAPVPTDGYLKIQTTNLTWRGLEIGELKADIDVEDGILEAKSVKLQRLGEAKPILSLSGRVPLGGSDTGLNTNISVANVQVPYVLAVLAEARDFLRTTDTSVPLFERTVDVLDGLPPGTTGVVGLEANITGTIKDPRVDVSNLTLRDGRARVPAGGLSPPATLDAAFVFENGSVQLERADFKLQKRARGSVVPEGEEEEDTLLRLTEPGEITPDGPLDIDAEILNANLSQVATWVPAFRGRDGSPLLRGELSLFTLAVSGSTDNPVLAGSIEAENLKFNENSLDRLQLSFFQIKDGFLTIEPDKLKIKKGNFESSSASGTIPWSWTNPGPIRDQPIQINLPVQKKDFGALIGFFVPTLLAADADEFTGAVDITGTIDEPKITGQVKVSGGRVRLDPKQIALAIGLSDLSGTIKFRDGNRVEIDEADPVKARLVTATDVEARPVRKARRDTSQDLPDLAGQVLLRGSVELDLLTADVVDPRAAMARHRYNLRLSLDGARYSTPEISGLQNVALGFVWKTGAGRPEYNQNLRWMLAAEGKPDKRNKEPGKVHSVGSLRLRPNFATGLDALAYSEAIDVDTTADFTGMPVTERLKLQEFPDRRSQILVQALPFNVKDLGGGQLDGRILLDNREVGQSAPAEAVALQRAQLTTRLRAQQKRLAFFGTGLPGAKDYLVGGYADFPRLIQDGGEPPPDTRSLRLAGNLLLSDAEFYGAPAGGGIPTQLSILPEAPRLDLKLTLGRSVQIVTSALRATLLGEIVAGGTPRNPQVFGSVSTREGQVRFPNARARVEEGQVTIAATRDPETNFLRTRIEIDVTARGTAGRYDITLRMRGPLDVGDSATQNLKVEVESNPPLSQNDAFQQLLGTTVQRENGQVDQAYAQAVLQVVSAPLFSGVENTIAQALGLSTVSLEYRFNQPILVQLSKNVGDRAIITYRRTVGNSTPGVKPPFQLRVDYRLKGELLVGLQTDEQGIHAVNLQRNWRF